MLLSVAVSFTTASMAVPLPHIEFVVSIFCLLALETPSSPFACCVTSGTCRRVSDEAGVGPQTVPDPERLSLCERRHQPPEPAAAITSGGVRQETDLAARRDRHRPV